MDSLEPEEFELGHLDPWEDWRWEHLPLGPEYLLFERQRQIDLMPWRLPRPWLKSVSDGRGNGLDSNAFAAAKSAGLHLWPSHGPGPTT